MAESKILIEVTLKDGVSKPSEPVQRALRVTKDNFDKLTDAQKKSIIQDKKKALAAKALDNELTQQAKSVKASTKALDQNRAQSGLNNAILIELGRTASDSQFGFQGMANNIGRLVELGQEFARTGGGGVMDSLKTLGRSILGTGGVLIGIQLLIALLPKLEKKFKEMTGDISDVSEAFKSVGEKASKSVGDFNIYIKTIQSSSKSTDEKYDALIRLKNEFPDYIQQLMDAGVSMEDVANNTEAAAKQNDLYRDSIIRVARAEAAKEEIIKLQQESIELEQKRFDELRELGFEEKTQRQLQQEFLESLTESERKNIEERIKNSDDLTKFVVKTTDARGRVRSMEFKKNEEDLRRYVSAEEQAENAIKDIKQSSQEFQASGLKDMGLNELLRIQNALEYNQDEIASIQAVADTYLIYTDNRNKSNEKIDNATIKTNALNDNFFKEETRRIEELDRAILESILFQAPDGDDVLFLTDADMLDMSFGQYDKFMSKYIAKTDEGINKREEQALRNFEMMAKDLEGLINYEEEKTKITDFYENLREEKRQKHMEQRFDDLARLFGEETRMGKASLLLKMNFANIEKAINDGVTWESLKNSLVTGTANFFEGLQTSAKAAPFPLNIPLIAGHIATASPFLLQLKAAVDMFKGKKSGGSPSVQGASVGGAQIQAPEFNIVGASNQSLLAQTVAGAESRPVKAFVVGKDISTQQELDRNITNTASLG